MHPLSLSRHMTLTDSLHAELWLIWQSAEVLLVCGMLCVWVLRSHLCTMQPVVKRLDSTLWHVRCRGAGMARSIAASC